MFPRNSAKGVDEVNYNQEVAAGRNSRQFTLAEHVDVTPKLEKGMLNIHLTREVLRNQSKQLKL